MGGTSSQTQSQQSTTAPWAPAQDTLTGILGQINNYLPTTGVNGTQQGAANQIYANNATAAQFTPAVNASTSALLSGGGALNQSPMLQAAYRNYQAQTNPLASNTNYDPMQTPGIGDQLQAIKDQVTQQVNGSFAAAGRDGSAYNQRALATGLAQGEAPILTNQYNQNVQNQQNAASNLYGAGNTTGGLLTALQQQYLGNQQAGVNQVGTGNAAINAAPSSTLQTATGLQQLPYQNLGLLANIGVPIGGLGGTSSGTSNTQTSLPWYAPLSSVSGLLGNFGQGKAFPSII